MTYVAGRAGHSGYEYRPLSYMSFVCRTPVVHVIPELDTVRRDWWKTGKGWIDPERCPWCEEAPCCGAAVGCNLTP